MLEMFRVVNKRGRNDRGHIGREHRMYERIELVLLCRSTPWGSFCIVVVEVWPQDHIHTRHRM